MKMGDLYLIVCNYFSRNLFTPFPKFIIRYLGEFFNRFQHMLGLDSTRKILRYNSWQVGQ